MYPFIVCHCGRCIGSLFDVFNELRNERIIAEFGDLSVDPRMMPLMDDLQIVMDDVFKMLYIDLDCCRARLICQVEFTDLY